MTNKKDHGNFDHFTEHSHPTAEQEGPLSDKNGKNLWSCDEGLMESLAEKAGFEFVNQAKEAE